MGASALRSLASCVLVLIASVSLLAADSAVAMLHADGAAWLNGSHVPNSSALFVGDLVQTRIDSAASIHAPGSSITVLGDSLIKFQGASLEIERGGLSISTSQGLAASAGDVHVAPASTSWTEFNVSDTDGTLHIFARKGDLTITDQNGSTTLAQGQETTRDDQAGQGNGKKKNKKPAGGAAPAANGGVLDSTAAVAAGSAAIAGVTTWVLLQSSSPVSPSNP